MNTSKTFPRFRIALVITTVVMVSLLTAATHVQAQCTAATGNNTVYGNCSGSIAVQPSAAYIDASASTNSTTQDFCLTLFNIINGSSYPGPGAVIDARGINSGNNSMSCTSNNTPWIKGPSSSFTANSSPATILLPAGTITISNTWIMPEYARIIGEGPGLTTIVAASSFSAGVDGVDAMIEMGTTSSNSSLSPFCGGNVDCVGVGVQDLILNLNSVSVSYGIYNAASQELSYVDNVVFNGVGSSASNGTYALEVTVVSGPASSNSGPYSNLVCNIGTSATSSTRCVDMQAHTRGVHGISCYGNGTPNAAIYLDSDSDSIEDVYVNGFVDGIYVGSQAQAPSNVLFNIAGGSSLTNLVHVSSATTSSAICPGGSQNVCDLTILNAMAAANTTIKDGDTNVGVYILGEQIGSTATTPPQYSRFTTSPRVPTWGVGNSVPSGACNASTANGSLYSNVATGTSGTLFACVANSWIKIK
jgi:Pectate lyase superfamily protein